MGRAIGLADRPQAFRAAGQLQQKAGHAFLGGFPPERQHLLLGDRQLVGGSLAQAKGHVGKPFEQTLELAALEPAGGRWADRLDAIGIGIPYRQADEVARKQKSHDLLPSVRQQFVEFDGA